ncbi:hypothetical protein H4R99_002402 [Coemansia sp. RSA 1722]|nr:hypothetical protein LPJ57_006456 [Coemansia sp. RSA 486]KAJ2603329.1 hypothetical protein H4R99_002402 [Coemansia sp. RSA 1722]
MDPNTSSIKVLFVGTGALGSIYAWRLQTSGQVEITAVCRSNYQAVSNNGFQIKSELYGTHTYRPTKVIQSVDEATDNYDFVVVCTKALPNRGDNSDIIAKAVGKDTAIVVIQNGIGIEDPFVARYPNNPVISVVAYIDASQPSIGVIEHGSSSGLVLGSHPQANIGKLAQIWNQNGVKCLVTDNIQAFRWLKLVWNASFNPISVVSGGNDTQKMLADPACRKLIRDVMVEVYQLGEKVVGMPLPVFMNVDGPDAYIKYTDRPGTTVYPSMLMDYQAGRPMEHAVILGRPIELANELGVPVPRLEAIHALLLMIEKKYLK